MYSKYIKLSTFLPLLIFFFAACDLRDIPDVSHIDVSLRIDRFEQDFFALDLTSESFSLLPLEEQYPEFFPVYFEQIMHFGNLADTLQRYRFQLNRFLANQAIRGLYDTCQAHFGDISPLHNELEDAFRYYRFYFPDEEIPRVVTMITEFNFAAITTDRVLGIGLDMHLGRNYVYYNAPELNFPRYKIRKFSPEYMVPNAMRSWLMGQFEKGAQKNDLINHMIYNGKILYLLDHILPYTPDSLKIGLSEQQLDWCADNEAEIWAFFIKHELLYSTDLLEFRKYINDGPTTPGMPAESPGNVGSWVGWQIVKAYMQSNPGLSLDKLMAINDGKMILLQSQYKPGKFGF